MIFDKPIAVKKDIKYDLSLKWKANYFQTKNGNNGKDKVEMITFSKSSYDTNGTSKTSGQIAGLLINAKS